MKLEGCAAVVLVFKRRVDPTRSRSEDRGDGGDCQQRQRQRRQTLAAGQGAPPLGGNGNQAERKREVHDQRMHAAEGAPEIGAQVRNHQRRIESAREECECCGRDGRQEIDHWNHRSEMYLTTPIKDSQRRVEVQKSNDRILFRGIRLRLAQALQAANGEPKPISTFPRPGLVQPSHNQNVRHSK